MTPPLPPFSTTIHTFSDLIESNGMAKERYSIPKDTSFSVMVIEIFRGLCPPDIAENDARWPLHFTSDEARRKKAIEFVEGKLSLRIHLPSARKAGSTDAVPSVALPRLTMASESSSSTSPKETSLEGIAMSRRRRVVVQTLSSLPPSGGAGKPPPGSSPKASLSSSSTSSDRTGSMHKASQNLAHSPYARGGAGGPASPLIRAADTLLKAK